MRYSLQNNTSYSNINVLYNSTQASNPSLFSNRTTQYSYGYQGSEKDNEISGQENRHITTYYREGDTYTGQWWSPDRAKPNASESPYAMMSRNPILYNDVRGDSVWLYATTLPGAPNNWAVNQATHTFLVVKTDDGDIKYYVYGPQSDINGNVSVLGGSPLVQTSYSQDKAVYKGTDTEHLKAKIQVTIPEGMTSSEFDQQVIKTAESFGNNPGIKYNAVSDCETTGNCNSSTSTVLSKSGVSGKEISNIEGQIPGLNWGFGDVKPWTATEQKGAVQKEEKKAETENKFIDAGPKY